MKPGQKATPLRKKIPTLDIQVRQNSSNRCGKTGWRLPYHLLQEKKQNQMPKKPQTTLNE